MPVDSGHGSARRSMSFRVINLQEHMGSRGMLEGHKLVVRWKMWQIL